jgi:hypothetical protein
MTPDRDIHQIRSQARRAGWLYVLMGITAPLGLLIVPGRLVVRGDAAATAEHLRSMEWLLRLGIASELFHQVVGIFLVLALYRLFRDVNKDWARLVVILGALVSVPIVFVNVLNELAALIFAKAPAYLLSTFDRPQLDALAYLAMRLHTLGFHVVGVFWALWLFPYGLLVIRSRFMPRWIGVSLLIAGMGYLIGSFTALIVPALAPSVGQVADLMRFGELPIFFWLVIWGAREQKPRTTGATPTSATPASPAPVRIGP